MNKEIVFLAGLPRSGSTLLSNILAAHDDVYATPSSPLSPCIEHIRDNLSWNPFFKAQLDKDYMEIHERLKDAMRGFIEGWLFHNSDKKTFVDKNRNWLLMIESLRELYPNFKMIITLRDLRNVYASIERRHRKTLFFGFPDKTQHNVVDYRANDFFADGGIIGTSVKALENLQDIPDILKHLYFWRYEHYLKDPEGQTKGLFEFLGLEAPKIDFNNIIQYTHESDSHCNQKYSHKILNGVEFNKHTDDISPRILRIIESRFFWYYEKYYPELLTQTDSNEFALPIQAQDVPSKKSKEEELAEVMRKEF